MGDVKFTWNQRAIDEMTADIDRKVNDAVENVAAKCAGQEVGVIIPQLRRALLAVGVEPNERGIREMAETISKTSP